MDKSVIISIRGTQTLDDNPPETVELITEGRLIDCGEEGYTLTCLLYTSDAADEL